MAKANDTNEANFPDKDSSDKVVEANLASVSNEADELD